MNVHIRPLDHFGFRMTLEGLLVGISVCLIFISETYAQKTESQSDSLSSNRTASTPKLSEATEITDKQRNARLPTKAPPVVDEETAAKEKRAREQAKLRGELTFDDLKFDIEKDGLFEEKMLTDDIRKLNGKKVRIRGFMLPSSVFQTKDIKQFVLVRDNQECCFGPGAAIYDCIMIDMEAGKSTDFNLRVMTVSGLLTIDTKSYQYPDGGHYAIYKIVASEAK
jgi:hypothetical protein